MDRNDADLQVCDETSAGLIDFEMEIKGPFQSGKVTIPIFAQP